jgi:hypothetical protein
MPFEGDRSVTDSTTLERARKALAAHDWSDAYDAFASASVEEALTGEDLEAQAEAAWWTAHPNESIDAMERAYAVYSREGNPRRAAYVALNLADQWGERLQSAQAAGWFQRATRLLEGQPESVEHGYLELAKAKNAGGVDEMMQHAAATLDIGTRFENRDLQAYGLMLQGVAHIAQAQVDQGMALIDEATVAAVGGDLSPFATGVVYCLTIVVCRDLADYRRAGEWTEATTRWCERQAINGFPGHCRVRRAEIMRLRGAFAGAEEEARRAVKELISFGDLAIAGVGFHEIGEIRLRDRRPGRGRGSVRGGASARERGAARTRAAAVGAGALRRGSLLDPGGPGRPADPVDEGSPAPRPGRDRTRRARRGGGTRGCGGVARHRLDLRSAALARERAPGDRNRARVRG